MLKKIFVFCVCCSVLLSCKQNSQKQKVDAVRIVSFSPGITQTVVDLGCGELIVGRSAFCNAVPSDVPVVGDLLGIDFERLLLLKPTHVFVQQTQSPIHPHLLELNEQGVFTMQMWKLNRLQDIQQIVEDLSLQLNDEQSTVELQIEPKPELPSPILIVTQGAPKSAGLCFGRETYLNDIIEMMGVENAIEQTGWRTLSLEDIVKLQPKCILVVSDTVIQEESLEGIRSLGIQVIPFVHRNVLIPSSQILQVANALQESVENQ